MPTVCALNGGAKNGVQCFKSTIHGLVAIPNSNRSLKLTQFTPPSGNTSLYSVSQVLFSPDGSKLVVSVKGLITSSSTASGYLAIWDVYPDGSLSQHYSSFFPPTQASQMPFGTTFLHGKEGYVVTDDIHGGLVYDFSKGYSLPPVVKSFVIPGQKATCWISYSTKSNTYFLTDAGTGIINEYLIDDSTLDATLVNPHKFPPNVVLLDNVIGAFGNDQ
jgi:hypothetical protein